MRFVRSAALICALTVVTALVPTSAFAHDDASDVETAEGPPVANASATPIAFQRISGIDRFATAVAVAGEYEPGVPVLYITTGSNFPDALSAAPAAAAQGGPLLLTPGDELPAIVREVIVSLVPAKIVVVGGSAIVSDAVYNELSTLAPAIRRDAGADRYETSRIVNQNAFPAGTTTTAFFATGRNFPDALSASAAAGSTNSPVILVDGIGSTVDPATDELLTTLGVESAKIAGGTAVVSADIEAALRVTLGQDAVVRYAGANRYATASAINRASFTEAPTAFLAVGSGFADALAGAALAGRDNAPLYLVQNSCVPSYVAVDLQTLNTSKRILLGGIGALGPLVETSRICVGFNQPFSTVVPVSSSFGMRIHPITHVETMHRGTDYAKSGIFGTPIRAIAEGTVVARNVSSSTSGQGNSVTVRHPNGVESLSMHMRDASPRSIGQFVEAGSIIGYVGATGGVTGPHLHLEIRVDGVHVDPVVFLKTAPLAPVLK